MVIVGLNLLLGERALGSAQTTRQAAAWQQSTRGVTYAPPVTNSRPFKALRLRERAAEINTVVLGASSLMGVTEPMFATPLKPYNFALTANPTAMVAGEAEYIERHHGQQIRNYVIGLDWAIGVLYQPATAADVDLAPETLLAAYRDNEAHVAQKLTDAIALPKVKNLGDMLRAVMLAPQPAAAFRAAFFENAGEPYDCPGGVKGMQGRDYDVVHRGKCLGFRHDGSWTFANEQHLSEARTRVLAQAAAAPSSQFARYLCSAQGAPNAAVLQRLGEFAQRVMHSGGNVVFIVPPLIPGMVAEMLKSPALAACLSRTHDALDAWARKHGVSVIDAAPSERYGCLAGEFLDENHAWPECHARVMKHYALVRERHGSGLYRP